MVRAGEPHIVSSSFESIAVFVSVVAVKLMMIETHNMRLLIFVYVRLDMSISFNFISVYTAFNNVHI